MRDVDLNLLVVFDAVMTEGSLTRAAQRLATTQPAVSHALARLKQQHRDPLFVRAGRGVAPTPRARELHDSIQAPLAAIRAAARPPQAFDPLALRQRLRVASMGPVVDLLWPRLRAHLDRVAPGVDLHAIPLSSETVPTILESAAADVALSPFEVDLPSLRTRALSEHRVACVMRRDHPAARLPLDAARYAALNHVVVSSLGQPATPIDAALARIGLARRVSVTLPGIAALPALLETTDVVATVVVDLVASLLDPARFVARPLPLPMPPVVLRMAWHERHDRDPVHRWLREQIAAAMDEAVEPREASQSVRSLVAA